MSSAMLMAEKYMTWG